MTANKQRGATLTSTIITDFYRRIFFNTGV